MPEILVKFDEPIAAPSGARYFAQALAGEVKGGLWEGWLEFFPASEGVRALESARETTQPNRTGVEYWSQGLTRVYLEGALARAVALAENSTGAAVARAATARFNTFGHRPPVAPSQRATIIPRAILNPIQVYAQGEAILRRELGALSRDHIESICSAYDLVPAESAAGLPTGDLISRIIEGARARQRPFSANSEGQRAEL